MTEVQLLKDFSRNLRAALHESGTTQQELSDITGISKSTISKYVHGEYMPSLRNLVNIMDALCCRFDDLVDNVEQVR